jgi:hypothetical protein
MSPEQKLHLIDSEITRFLDDERVDEDLREAVHVDRVRRILELT